MNSKLKINIGSGNERIDGFKNVDILNLPEVDFVCDISKGLPFEDNSVSEVYACHCLEHIKNLPALMEELYRVCENRAVIKIKCPYFKSDGAFKDPTHVNFITEHTFDYFDRSIISKAKIPDYGFKCNLEIDKISYVWSKPWIRFVPFKKQLFIKYFWNIARSIYFQITVIKK